MGLNVGIEITVNHTCDGYMTHGYFDLFVRNHPLDTLGQSVRDFMATRFPGVPYLGAHVTYADPILSIDMRPGSACPVLGDLEEALAVWAIRTVPLRSIAFYSA